MYVSLMLAIIFGGSVLALAIVGSTILMAVKILKGGVSREERKKQSEEARIIQEVYQGLSKMEQRVEALETIILDRDRKDQ
ncbi:MAG: phage-shock protein [Deltaproteobacteria bacterium]